MLVSDIGTDHILKVLEPIWLKKTETASRVRGRIESILSWSTARGYRNGENPARWRGHLDQMLPARSKVQRVRHHPAMCYSELPEFMAELRKEKGVAARALEFTILTASRTNEVINARWVEITLDGVKPVWVIPRERMKADKEHRVPLTRAVVAVLRSLPVMDDCDWVFPGRPGRPLSSAAMRTILQRMGRSDVTTHGFRSSFRDWCGEETSFPRDVVEAALAHQLRDKTEAAYRRGDALEHRRKLMDAWSKYALALQDKAVRLVRTSG